MIPIKDKKYTLEFKSLVDSSIDYNGPGVFTGKTIRDTEGLQLFLFNELTVKKGTTPDGWFSEDDIKEEL